MKTKALFLICLLIPATAAAESLFGDAAEKGWFFAPTVTLSELNGDFGVLLGGEAMLLANGEWGLGLGFGGVVTRREFIFGATDSLRRASLAFAGFKLGHFMAPDFLIHPTFGALLGIGGAGTAYRRLVQTNNHMDEDWEWDHQPVFVFEPQVGGELNILETIRLDAAVSYRLVAGFNETYDLNSQDFSGLGAKIAIKFGRMSGSSNRKQPWW